MKLFYIKNHFNIKFKTKPVVYLEKFVILNF